MNLEVIREVIKSLKAKQAILEADMSPTDLIKPIAALEEFLRFNEDDGK